MQERADYFVSMLLSPAMLPHLNAAFRNGNSGTLDAESEQSLTTSGVFHPRIVFFLILKMLILVTKISYKSGRSLGGGAMRNYSWNSE